MTSIAKLPAKGSKKKARNDYKYSVFAAQDWIRDHLVNLSSSERHILMMLSTRIDKNFEAFPSRKKIASDTGYSIAHISRTLSKLEGKKLITIQHRFTEKGEPDSNLYRLLVPPKYKSKTKGGSDLGSLGVVISDHGGSDLGSPGVVITEHTNYPLGTSQGNYPEGTDNPQEGGNSEPLPGSLVYQPADAGLSGEPQGEGDSLDEQTECLIEQADEYDEAMNEEKAKNSKKASENLDNAYRKYFPVSHDFDHQKLSANARVAFWMSCLEKYRPDNYSPNKNLSKRQSDCLHELFAMEDLHGETRPALVPKAVIEWTVKQWDRIHENALEDCYPSNGEKCTKPPNNPTTTWIAQNLSYCERYYRNTVPAILGVFKHF